LLGGALSTAMVFIGLTFRDDSSISGADAVHFGVPSVAGDVCERGPAPVVFRCGDLDDFHRCTRQVLDSCRQCS